MIKLEKILGIIIAISFVLYLFLIPSSFVVFAFSLLVLSLLYCYFGFLFFNGIRFRKIFTKEAYKGISTSRIFGAVAAGLVLSLTCLGILFKIGHYPGATFALLGGLAQMLILGVIVLIKYAKNKDFYYVRIMKRMFIIGGFALLLYLLPALTIEKIRYRNHPQYIEAYEAFLENPESVELSNKKELELNRAIMSEQEFQEYLESIPKSN